MFSLQMKIMLMYMYVMYVAFLSRLSTSLSVEEETRVDDFIEAVMECADLPGLSLAAVQEGELVLTKGYGKANLENGTDVDDHTLFNIASLSKAFTGMLLAIQLSENNQGHHWNTPAKEILGERFHMINGYYTNQTTLRDLLEHKTGIPAHDFMWFLDTFDREELIERLRFLEPVHPFRNEFIYSNIMYALAGTISSAMGGTSWEDLVEEYIFNPIGMTSAMFMQHAPSDYNGFAVPYARMSLGGPYEAIPSEQFNIGRAIGPAGGIGASGYDMALWLQFLLNEGTTQNGDQLLSPEDFKSYITPGFSTEYTHSPLFPPLPTFYKLNEKYGKGWNNGFYRGSHLVSHSGGIPGYSSLIHLLPHQQIGSYISVNAWDVGVNMYVLPYVNDVLMGVEPWISAEDLCSNLPNIRQQTNPMPFQNLTSYINKEMKPSSNSKLDRNLLEYEGDYGNFAYGNITIALTEDNTELELIVGNNGLYELVPTIFPDSFFLNGKNIVSSVRPLILVEFSSSQGHGVIDTLRLPLAEPLDPPIFLKGLMLADAPPPDISSCN